MSTEGRPHFKGRPVVSVTGYCVGSTLERVAPRRAATTGKCPDEMRERAVRTVFGAPNGGCAGCVQPANAPLTSLDNR